MNNWVLSLLTVSSSLNLLLGFVLYFVYQDLKCYKKNLRQCYLDFLNRTAKGIFELLKLELDKVATQKNGPERDAFNRRIGRVFATTAEMMHLGDFGASRNSLSIQGQFFALFPNEATMQKEEIGDFLLYLQEKEKTTDVELMLEIVTGRNDEFENRMRKCRNAVESIADEID